MFIVVTLIALAAITFLCWLLFTLASYVLPFYVGLTMTVWAFHGGSGVIASLLAGILAAGLTLGVGQLLLVLLPWAWARLSVAALLVAPAIVAGYYASHGVAKHLIPSEFWQIVLSIMGAVAVGFASWLRIIASAGAAFDKR
ncbi:hypothetical protein [Shinella sp. NM-101]|uniref:hypothetical protein n=1 Tax=Shinella sp. NM-101 TaxID=2744455 RepID=UPI001F311404|nr:hypothetical protein [Shinella sp. NM-101]